MTLIGALLLATTPLVLDYTSREVHFKGYKDFELVGTYLAPKGKTAGPAVMLVAGSGPTDRNGDSGPLKIGTLREIAEGMAARGIATLRYDKRSVAATYRAKFPAKLSDYEDFFSFEAFTGDAEGGMAWLRSQPEVDPTRTAVLGHSEGGLIALAIAGRVKPKGLILVATAGRDLGVVVEEQIGQGFSAQFTPKDTLAKLVSDTKRAVASVRNGSPVPQDIHPALKAVFPSYAARLLHSEMTINPVDLAKEFHGPALLVQGDKDVQISVDRDLPLLRSALPHADVMVVKGGTHCLKVWKDAKDPGFGGPVVPGTVGQMADWASKNL
ncbi:MAG: acetylxylan esterase [Fimbriimonadaceae bacterium]|nr:acetylxylan esterase [Fimbriimonadaceae bacterium]